MAKTVKCENCGTEGTLLEGGPYRRRLLVGWQNTGRSKKFPEQGSAHWCPKCKHLREEFCLRQLLPKASEAEIKALLDDIELQKLREN